MPPGRAMTRNGPYSLMALVFTAAAVSLGAWSNAIADDQKAALDDFDRYLEKRTALQQGACTIDSTTEREGAPNYSSTAFIAFDYPKKSMRVDLRSEGFHIGRDGKMSAVEHQTKRALYDGKVTLWERELKRVSITGFIDNSELWPGLIDMRLFGLTNNHSLSSTKLIEPEIRSDRPSSIEAANGMTRFTWRSSGFMRIVTVDPQLDFVVKEMEIRQLAGDGDADSVKEKTLSKSVIEWDRQNSVSVPVKAVHEELSGDPRTIRQTIRWETVNSVIDSKVFSVDGFGLPDGTVVGDETTTPTRRGMIREGKAQFKSALGNPKRRRKPAASQP